MAKRLMGTMGLPVIRVLVVDGDGDLAATLHHVESPVRAQTVWNSRLQKALFTTGSPSFGSRAAPWAPQREFIVTAKSLNMRQIGP